jgi:hypothetical protein
MAFLRLRRTLAWPERNLKKLPKVPQTELSPLSRKRTTIPRRLDPPDACSRISPEEPARVLALQAVASFGPPKRTNERH